MSIKLTENKSSNIHERAQIGCNYIDRPKWQKLIALPLIYVPILISVPFIIFAVVIVRLHLTITGAKNLKRYRDFLPTWLSHRYTYENQVTCARSKVVRPLAKVFWLFNCKLYCPLSVGLIKYLSYLIQIVEMWWCPFNHDKKCTYIGSDIDQSYWHIYPETSKLLHYEDRVNPMWNDDEVSQDSIKPHK